MSVKIALLKSGESVIADIKELIQEDKICGYLFKNPYVVGLQPRFQLLTEEPSEETDVETNISFTPWIPFTMDKDIPVRHDWLVTVVSPAKQIQELYEEMINGQNDQSDSTVEQ